MKVELLYDADCPNVDAARENLVQAFAIARVTPHWVELNLADVRESSAERYPSPTILIDGVDVEGASAQSAGACCRIYRAPDGLAGGAPPVDLIARVLRAAAK